MIIKTQNKYKDFVIRKLLGLVYRLENIGNGDIKDSGELNFISNLSKYYKEPITFFDIGANIGEYTKTIKEQRNNGKDIYHLFEPQKSCYNELKTKFNNDKNIIINNIGLSDTKTEATIYKNSDKSGLTSLFKRNLEFYDLKMNIEEKIILDTASDYIEKNNINKVNLIKIDVEGNEIKTLNGFGKYLNSDFIDFIQFEYGGANIDSHTNLMDFFTLLENKGFKLCKIMKNNLEYRKYNPRLDNFVCQNYIAVSDRIFNSLSK